jgi:hypothetical protein
MNNMRPVTLEPTPDGVHFLVKRGVTFLAVVSFTGPRGTIVTHQGHLYQDERQEVYRLHAALTAK